MLPPEDCAPLRLKIFGYAGRPWHVLKEGGCEGRSECRNGPGSLDVRVLVPLDRRQARIPKILTLFKTKAIEDRETCYISPLLLPFVCQSTPKTSENPDHPERGNRTTRPHETPLLWLHKHDPHFSQSLGPVATDPTGNSKAHRHPVPEWIRSSILNSPLEHGGDRTFRHFHSTRGSTCDASRP